MKKIAVIGIGTVGIVSLLTILVKLVQTRKEKDFQIDIIHNPKIPKVSVGEGTTYVVKEDLQVLFGIKKTYEILDKCGFTFKKDVKFFWEEGLGKNFDIPHTTDGDIHFDSLEFTNELVKEIPKKFDIVKIVEGDVNEIDLDYDLIFDCSGFPSKEELETDYTLPDIETVNSAIVYASPKYYDENYTSSYFHQNGWMFGIPLKHRKTFGYLYNKNKTTYDEALVDFKQRLPILEEDKIKKFDWNFYYRNKIIEGNRVFLGNKLYLYEPAGALPIHFYHMMSEKVIEVFLNDEFHHEFKVWFNMSYKEQVKKILDLVCLNYIGKVKSESKFWKEIKEEAINHFKNSEEWQEYLNKCKDNKTIYDYWQHQGSLLHYYLTGFEIDLMETDNA